MKEPKRISLATFVVALLVMAAICVVLIYMIVSDKNKDNKEKNTNKVSNSAVVNNKNSGNNDISVVDAVNYSDGYYELFKVKLPKVVGNTKTIEELNLKILNEVLPLTYADVACHAMSKDTEEICMDKGSIYNYTYVIKNNILIIYIHSTVPEGGSTIPATGNGLNHRSYYYDITNDKILSINEVANRLKLSLDCTAFEHGDLITSYNELEKNGYIIKIEDNKLKIAYPW